MGHPLARAIAVQTDLLERLGTATVPDVAAMVSVANSIAALVSASMPPGEGPRGVSVEDPEAFHDLTSPSLSGDPPVQVLTPSRAWHRDALAKGGGPLPGEDSTQMFRRPRLTPLAPPLPDLPAGQHYMRADDVHLQEFTWNTDGLLETTDPRASTRDRIRQRLDVVRRGIERLPPGVLNVPLPKGGRGRR